MFPLTRMDRDTEAESLCMLRASSFFTCHCNHSHLGRKLEIYTQAGVKKGGPLAQKTRRAVLRKTKRLGAADLFLLAISSFFFFLLSFILSISSHVCVCRLHLSDPSSIQRLNLKRGGEGRGGGRNQTPPSFFYSIYLPFS